jgi:hypothetical protein
MALDARRVETRLVLGMIKRWSAVMTEKRAGWVRSLLMCGALLGGVGGVGCAVRTGAVSVASPAEVEVACGQCLFHLPGQGCDLAVRVGGHAYYVDGVRLDDLGDAHAKDGMCQRVRKARVTGEVRDGRFVVKQFELKPAGENR